MDAMEGITMSEANEQVKTALASAGEKAPRKRPGRPIAGGADADGVWKALTEKFLGDSKFKTKNGLPGIPYALKEIIIHLKEAWSDYSDEVLACDSADEAPKTWDWCWDKAAEFCTVILDDVHCSNAAGMLRALGAVCDLFGKKEAVKEYMEAEASTACGPLEPSYAIKKHGIKLSDLLKCRDYIRAKKREDANTPDTLRILGWGDVLLSILLNESGVQPGIEHLRPAFVNDLDLLTGEDLPQPESSHVGQEGVLYLWNSTTKSHDAVRLTSAEAKAAIAWAFAQREGGKTGDRFLPRRLSVETILSRLSKGPLSVPLKGRQLKMDHVYTVMMTHLYAEVLLALEKVSVPQEHHFHILTKTVFPSLLEASLPDLVYPPAGRPVQPEDLVKEGVACPGAASSS